MVDVSLTYAKAHFSALVKRALAGESIYITRRGKPLALLAAEHNSLGVPALEAPTAGMPEQTQTPAALDHEMRDSSHS